MTEQEAREAIRRPLTFGDDRQIRAIRLLDEIQRAVEVIKEAPECEECQGSGDIEIECEACLGEDCDMCCGEGFDIADCPTCQGLGYFVLDWPICKDEVIAAARNRIAWERRQR